MTLEIGPQNLPDLLAGLGMLALAALVLWVAPNNRLHRAFALLQFVNAGGSLIFVGFVGFEDTDPFLADVLRNVDTYYILALPFAAAYFTLRFLDPEGRWRASRPLGWGLLAGVVAVLAAFALDHGLYTVDRPLGLVWYARPLTFGAIALVFALGARRAEDPARREGLVLASLAFTLLGALGSVWRLVPGSPFTPSPEGPTLLAIIARALPLLSMLAVLATIAIILGARSLRSDPATRRSRHLFAVGAVLSGLSAFATIQLFAHDDVLFVRVGSALDGVWRVVMTVLLAYALLRRQLFDIQMKIRFAISRSTVAASFIAVFFVASEGAQILFGQGNEWVGLAAAGALVFAISPLQRAAERLAEKAVPVATPSGASAGSDNEDLYFRATGLALRDRVIAPEEELDLIELAERLGIGARRAAELRMTASRGSMVRRRKTAGAISRSRTGRGGRDP